MKYLVIFSLIFWQQTLFLWQRNLFWLFQIKFLCKIIFGSVSDDTLVKFENSVYRKYFMLCFLLFPLCFLLVKSFLSHAISPYLHGKLINWTSAFYLSFCCMVLPRILNILFFMNGVISIICICQLYFMFFHM